ncbi:MAG: hypothetical protein JWN30_285 [Bacilli bacterium]|nr:hypothetical protein [Bacilli bacterium]
MAFKVCKKCGEMNKENAVICYCGTSLMDVEIQGTKESEKKYTAFTNAASEPIRFCPYCKEAAKEGVFTCKNCGNIITKPSKGPSYVQHYYDDVDDGTRILLYIITFLFPIVGLIVGGVYSASDSTSKQSFGKNLLVFGISMIVIGFVIGLMIVLLFGGLLTH